MKKENLNLIIAVLVVVMLFVGAYFFFQKNEGPVIEDRLAKQVDFPVSTPTPEIVLPGSNVDAFPEISIETTPKNTPENIVENINNNPIALMKTNFGDIKLELFSKDAPKTVENFISLSESAFYEGVKFHRVIRDFMIQGGDPNSKDDDWSNDGMGGPGYTFEDEINKHKVVRGALAMANSGPDTNGSQFFIVTAEATPWLDGKHTVFGRVVEGLDIVSKIESVETNQNDHPTTDVVIASIEIQK